MNTGAGKGRWPQTNQTHPNPDQSRALPLGQSGLELPVRTVTDYRFKVAGHLSNVAFDFGPKPTPPFGLNAQ